MVLIARSFAIASFVAVLALTACAPKQTFPATDGSAGIDTNLAPFPDLCATAIKAGHAKSSMSAQPIVFNLPPGMWETTWSKVDALLPATARPATSDDRAFTSVTELRIDGGTADVDVMVPMGETFQLWTCHMTGSPFGPWKVDYMQPWTLRTTSPVCNAPVKATSETAPTAVTSGSER